ncbi:ROK family protein [Microvirga pudoricolor]|uniref:ROK family protein n=1 Tax=Microvirga pudoricolor TaxID=2778729 RepID=UPI001952828F|nr:ROK family protein [Microvirga pudoricolor]MBM6592835.1 ROK family protein [Microvirga pudoricolor]
MTGMRLGVDVGGTKIAAVVLDRNGHRIFHARRDTPKTYADVLHAIGGIVGECEGAVGAGASIGVGMPGSQSPRTGQWRNCNMTFINGRPFAADLEAALGRPIRIENDANCFALSEAIGGAGEGYPVVYALTLGTGLGGGLVVDGHVRRGANGVAAEIGHVPIVVPEGEPAPCYCGGLGCAESYVSGTGMARDHRLVTGETLSSPQIIAAMQAGDAGAIATFGRLTDRLARLVGMLANALDPDVIVLGGGLSTVAGLAEAVRDSAPRYVFGREAAPPIVLARTTESGARGAALLWD